VQIKQAAGNMLSIRYFFPLTLALSPPPPPPSPSSRDDESAAAAAAAASGGAATASGFGSSLLQ
jgi:hypothetical protein